MDDLYYIHEITKLPWKAIELIGKKDLIGIISPKNPDEFMFLGRIGNYPFKTIQRSDIPQIKTIVNDRGEEYTRLTVKVGINREVGNYKIEVRDNLVGNNFTLITPYDRNGNPTLWTCSVRPTGIMEKHISNLGIETI